MNRRRLLTQAGALAGALLSGCLGREDSSGSDAPPSGGPTASPTPAAASSADTTGAQTTRTQTNPSATTVVERRLTVEESSCGTTTNEGTIAVENGEIGLTGTITGSDGCATAVLGELTYDRARNRLRIVVATEDESEPGAVCAQCLTEIDYAATVRFEGRPPEVVLAHRTTAGETRVGTARA